MHELLYIIPSNLSSEEIEQTIKSVGSLLLDSFSAEIIFHKIWFKRKLSYPIKGKSHGHFVLCYFRTNPQKIEEINKELSIKPNILRHLIIKTNLKNVKGINYALKGLSKEVYIKKEQPVQTYKGNKPETRQQAVKKSSISGEVKTPITKPAEAVKETTAKAKIDLNDLDQKLDNILDEGGLNL